MTENVSDVSRIAFGTVVDKHLRVGKVDATWDIVVFYHRFDEEVISLFRAVSPECFGVCHLFYGFMHRFDARRGQRTGYVSDAQSDDVLFRMCYFERIYPFRDVREQITAR